MFNMRPLQNLATLRGDGLHPLLLELIATRQATYEGTTKVADLAQRRGDPFVQSGPHPMGGKPSGLPAGVVRLKSRESGPSPADRAASAK